jgi:methionyl-tRNA formyltransferase
MLSGLLADPMAHVVTVITSSPSEAPKLSGSVDLAAVARPFGIPLLRGVDLASENGRQIIARLDLDLMVVVGWTRLIPGNVLTLPRHGCVGFHASLLPHHRGRAPVNWSIIRGEVETGASMLLLDADADTGPIIDQQRITIGVSDTCGTVYERVADAGVQMMRRQLPALLAGRAPKRPQRADDGDVLPRRTPEMGITDWTRTPREIHDWIRALTHPYPGAFSQLGGRTVRLWRAEPGPELSPTVQCRAGTILDCVDDGVIVAARHGTVRLLTVQDSDCEQPAAEWYRDRDLHRGRSAFEPVDSTTSRWARGLRPIAEDTAARTPAARTIAVRITAAR